MTKEQLDIIFSELNEQFAEESELLYGQNIWLPMDEVSEIILLSNECVYPDETLQVYFDEENELLLTAEGRYQDNVFVRSKIASATKYSQVIGFIMRRPSSRKSPYKFSSTI
jgi:hypothetical protein